MVEPYDRKSGTIPEILPWILKFMSVYKLVALSTLNGFFYTKFNPTLDILEWKKSLFLFKSLLLWARIARSQFYTFYTVLLSLHVNVTRHFEILSIKSPNCHTNHRFLVNIKNLSDFQSTCEAFWWSELKARFLESKNGKKLKIGGHFVKWNRPFGSVTP